MRRAGLQLALACALVSSGFSAVAASERALVLAGDRSASVVVNLTSPVVLHVNVSTRGPGATITGGDLAGFLVADPSGRRVYGSMLLTRAMDPDGGADRLWSGPALIRLARGRYLFTLVATGPTEVRIPIEGTRTSLSYRPRSPVEVRITEVPLTGLSGRAVPASPTFGGRAPAEVGPRTVTVLALRQRTTGTKLTAVLCLSRIGGGCPDGASVANRSQLVRGPLPMIDAPTGFGAMILPGEVPAGRYDAAWTVETDGVGSSAYGTLIRIG